MGVVVYKCINCGGPLSFKAETQNWTCDYCLSEFSEQEVRAFAANQQKEGSIEPKPSSAEEYDEHAVGYSCQSCGAEIVTDETTAATFCYYCHNPTILPRRLEGEFRPEKVIPFKLDRDKATELFIQWCRKKPLLPKFFTSASELEKLSGIYVPFWLFDCGADGHIHGEATRVRSYTIGDTRYTETKFYKVLREGKAIFREVPADGSKKMDDELMHILEPFDYKDLTDFSMSYLSGFLAEKYDMDKNAVSGRISELIRENMVSMLRGTINGYSSVKIMESNSKLSQVSATYVLLPVWMFTYHFNGKTFIFAMNGQTGKIAGKLPISIPKAAAWFSGIAGSVFALLAIGGTFLW